jgi:acetyl-CoA acetyltransferase
LSAACSAIATFGGSLSSFAPEDLGAIVARAAFERSGVDAKQAAYFISKLPVPLSTSPCRATALSSARLRGTNNLEME